jgi:hypothetical protein
MRRSIKAVVATLAAIYAFAASAAPPSVRIVVPQAADAQGVTWREDWSDPTLPVWSVLNGDPDLRADDGLMGSVHARLPGPSESIGRLMSSIFIDNMEPSSGTIRVRIGDGPSYWNAVAMLFAGEVTYDGFSIMGQEAPRVLRLGNADFNGAIVGDGTLESGEIADLEWEYSGNNVSPTWIRGRKNGGAWATKTAPTSGTGYLWPYQYGNLRLPFTPILIALRHDGLAAAKVDFGVLTVKGRILFGACDAWNGWLSSGWTLTNASLVPGPEPMPSGSYPNWTTTPIADVRPLLGGLTGVNASGTYNANARPTPLYPHTHGSTWGMRNGTWSATSPIIAPPEGYRYKEVRIITNNVADDLNVYLRDSVDESLLTGIEGNTSGIVPNSPGTFNDMTVDLTGMVPGKELYIDIQGSTSSSTASLPMQQARVSALWVAFEPDTAPPPEPVTGPTFRRAGNGQVLRLRKADGSQISIRRR